MTHLLFGGAVEIGKSVRLRLAGHDFLVGVNVVGKVPIGLVVLFASRMADIYEQFPRAERSLNDGGRLWIAWPKQSSGVKTAITQQAVREFGLAAGWVDFKICAIDETWSGLAFARRTAKSNRAPR